MLINVDCLRAKKKIKQTKEKIEDFS